MANLTMRQIGAVAYKAGFRDKVSLARAIAVAMGESGGNPLAVNVNKDGSRDRGLWQINTVHSQYSDAVCFNPDGCAKAAYAISSGGKSWSPWVAWTSGSASKFLPEATLAAGAVLQQDATGVDFTLPDIDIPNPLDLLPDIIPSPGDVVDGMVSVGKALLEIAKAAFTVTGFVIKSALWLANPHNWLRVLEVIAGCGIAIIGLRMLANTGVGGPVGAVARGTRKATGAAGRAAGKAAKAGAKATPAGRAVTAAKQGIKAKAKPKPKPAPKAPAPKKATAGSPKKAAATPKPKASE